MKPPKVYEDTMPSSHSTSRMTKMVHSIPASQSVDAVRSARPGTFQLDAGRRKRRRPAGADIVLEEAAGVGDHCHPTSVGDATFCTIRFVGRGCQPRRSQICERPCPKPPGSGDVPTIRKTIAPT